MSGNEDPNREVVLESVRNEIEAALVVNALAAHGILATSLGEFGAENRTPTPGEVSILVAIGEHSRAKQVLAEIRDKAKHRQR